MTRLATAKTSRVSIHVTKTFGQDRGRDRVDPVKIFLSSSLITMQNLTAVSPAVCAHVYRRSQNKRDAMARPLRSAPGWPLEIRLPHALPYQI